MFRLPNVLGGAIRLLAWFFWRDPPMATTSPKPRQPRRPLLMYVQAPVPDEVLAVLRFCYFRQGIARQVEEYKLFEEEGCFELLRYVVDQALEQGADVSVIAAYDPKDLGLEPAEVPAA